MHIVKFFHHLFNPHCAACEHAGACKTCETLRELLESEKYKSEKLLNQILALTSPKVEQEISREMPALEDLKPRHISWRVQKEMLEAEDRKHAEKLRKNLDKEIGALKTTEQLEKELLTGDI